MHEKEVISMILIIQIYLFLAACCGVINGWNNSKTPFLIAGGLTIGAFVFAGQSRDAWRVNLAMGILGAAIVVFVMAL